MNVDNISVRLKNLNDRSTEKKKRRDRAIEYKTETFTKKNILCIQKSFKIKFAMLN